MTLYFQILMSEISTPEERGSAMALGGLGWSLSHLTTPLVMGAMSDAIGIINAFYAIGVFAIAWGIGLSGAHRRLHPDR